MQMERQGGNPLQHVQSAESEGETTFQQQLQQCVGEIFARQEQAQSLIRPAREQASTLNLTQHETAALKKLRSTSQR